MVGGPTPAYDSTPDDLRQCVRDRMRLARELAARRAALAMTAQQYEQVVRKMKMLARSLGIDQQESGHPLAAEWAALLALGDDPFLKDEQRVVDQLLLKFP